jgi:hypothetical protein
MKKRQLEWGGYHEGKREMKKRPLEKAGFTLLHCLPPENWVWSFEDWDMFYAKRGTTVRKEICTTTQGQKKTPAFCIAQLVKSGLCTDGGGHC